MRDDMRDWKGSMRGVRGEGSSVREHDGLREQCERGCDGLERQCEGTEGFRISVREDVMG